MNFFDKIPGFIGSAVSSIGSFFKNIFAPSAGGDIPAGTPGTIPVLTGRGTFGQYASPQEIKEQQQAFSAAPGISPFADIPSLPTLPKSTTTNVPFSGIRTSRPPPTSPAPQSAPQPSERLNFAPAQQPSVGASGIQGGTFGASQPAVGASGAGGTGSAAPTGSSSVGTVASSAQVLNPNEESKNKPRNFIARANPFDNPAMYGLTPTTTPQGGTMFRDNLGNAYIPQANGFQLVTSLPGNLQTVATPSGQTNISGANVGNVNVAPSPQSSPQPGVTTLQPPQSQPFTMSLPQFSAGNPPNSFELNRLQTNLQTLSGIISKGGVAENSPEAAQLQDFLNRVGGKLNEVGANFNPADYTRENFENGIQRNQADTSSFYNVSNHTPNNSGFSVSHDDAAQQEYLNGLNPVDRAIAESRLDQLKNLQSFSYTDKEGHTFNGVPALEANRIDILKEINSRNIMAAKVYHDTLNNPDLPTSLAYKQIKAFNEQNDIAIKNLQGQLETVTGQIGYANEAVNSALGISHFAQEQDYRKTVANRNFILDLTKDGQLAQYSDDQLKSLANQTGFPLEQLMQFRSAALQKPLDIRYETDINNNVRAIGTYLKKDGGVESKVIGNLGPIGKGISPLITLQAGAIQDVEKTAEPSTNYFTGSNPNAIQKYYDLSQYPDKTLQLKIIAKAKREGIPYIDVNDSKQMEPLIASKNNMLLAYERMFNYFSANGITRLPNIFGQEISKLSQANPELASIRLFNDSALNALMTLSRIAPGRFTAKIADMTGGLKNFLQSGDTLATAGVKIRNIMDQLDNQGSSMLHTSSPTVSGGKSEGSSGTTPSGLKYTITK